MLRLVVRDDPHPPLIYSNNILKYGNLSFAAKWVVICQIIEDNSRLWWRNRKGTMHMTNQSPFGEHKSRFELDCIATECFVLCAMYIHKGKLTWAETWNVYRSSFSAHSLVLGLKTTHKDKHLNKNDDDFNDDNDERWGCPSFHGSHGIGLLGDCHCHLTSPSKKRWLSDLVFLGPKAL